MYNWSVPAGLKAYIDQVMRINETWKFRSGVPDDDYVGLLENKKSSSFQHGVIQDMEKMRRTAISIFKPLI